MKKRKNIGAKIVAFIALGAIVIGIIGTGILFIVGSWQSYNTDEISGEDLQRLIESLPETTATGELDAGEVSQ